MLEQVGQQELNALGVSTCSDLIQQRGLLSALFSEVAVDCFMEAGLGLGRTQHHERLRDGEVGRKGMSVERTFAVIHTTQDLEAKVDKSLLPRCQPCQLCWRSADSQPSVNCSAVSWQPSCRRSWKVRTSVERL